MSKHQFLLLGLAAALVACLLFVPGLPGGFVFDDIPNIVDNTGIQLGALSLSSLSKVAAASQLSGSSRFLPTLTFAIDYWRGGGADPATFKTTNLLIHAITVVALAWLLLKLMLISGMASTRAHWIALTLALAWGAHPLQVSSVLYSVQRLQTMGTLFLVLALLTYVQAREAQQRGMSGRTRLLATGLLWALAMACKEDATLLPAYTLALELILMHFNAADARLEKLLRRSYLLAAILGAAIYLLLVVPHYWTWNPYQARDFSTPERLLTQARVMCLYLWQIVLPWPGNMPFYYDWLQPSRGLLHPWTTLPALILLLSLIVLAWHQRHRRPLFALGTFWFFSAHFITSNVIGLELAFEHRNHFALIGALLAIGSLLGAAARRLRLTASARSISVVLLIGLMGGATISRAHAWRSNEALANASIASAPRSARAWAELCSTLMREGGGPNPKNTRLDDAITACGNGEKLAPYALNNPTLLIVLKTLRGDIDQDDWDRYQDRLNRAQMSWDNRRAPLLFAYYVRRGVALDKRQVMQAMSTLARRGDLEAFGLASIGYFVMNDMADPDAALPYFALAIQAAPPNDPFPAQLASEMRAKGRPDLARRIELVSAAIRDKAMIDAINAGGFQ